MANFALLLTLALAAMGSAHPVPRAAQDPAFDQPREGIQTSFPTSTLSGTKPGVFTGGSEQATRPLPSHLGNSVLPRPDPARPTSPATGASSFSSAAGSPASTASAGSPSPSPSPSSSATWHAQKGHLNLVSPLQILGQAADLGPLAIASDVSRGNPVGSLLLAWNAASSAQPAHVSLVPVQQTPANGTLSGTSAQTAMSASHMKHHSSGVAAAPLSSAVSHSHSASHSASRAASHTHFNSASRVNSSDPSAGLWDKTHNHASNKTHVQHVKIEFKDGDADEKLCASYKPVSWPLGPLFQPLSADLYSFGLEACHNGTFKSKGVSQVFVYDSRTRRVYPAERRGSAAPAQPEQAAQGSSNKTAAYDAAVMLFEPRRPSSHESASKSSASKTSVSVSASASVSTSPHTHSEPLSSNLSPKNSATLAPSSVAEPSATPIEILPRNLAARDAETKKSKDQSSDGSEDGSDSDEDCDDDDSDDDGSDDDGSDDDGSDDDSDDDSDCDESDSSDHASGSGASGSSGGSGSGSDDSGSNGGWKISLTGSDPLGNE